MLTLLLRYWSNAQNICNRMRGRPYPMHCHVSRKSGHARRSWYFSPSGSDRSRIGVQVVVGRVGWGWGWRDCLLDSYWLCWDRFPILLRRILLIELTEGRLNLSHTPSASSLSRISQAKMPGSRCFVSPNVLDYAWGSWPWVYCRQLRREVLSRFRCTEPESCSHSRERRGAACWCRKAWCPAGPALLSWSGWHWVGVFRSQKHRLAGSPPRRLALVMQIYERKRIA